jgi:hypothetical protein
MNYYCNPEVGSTDKCPSCGSDISGGCSSRDGSRVVFNQCHKARRAGLPRGSARLAAIALPVIFFVTIGTFSSSLLDIELDLPGAFIEASELNIWLSHMMLSIDDSRVQNIEMQGQIKDNQAELEVRSPTGKIEYLRPFSGLRELKQFLEIDDTSELQYSHDFDCDDFAFTLSQNAMNMGYQIFPYAEGDHLKNVAHVSLGTKSTAVYVIEPQTDEISLWGRVD